MKQTATIFLLLTNVLLSYAQQQKVLIYSRNGEGYVHKNIAASVEALEAICQEMEWEYTTTDTPLVFDKMEALNEYDVLVFTNTNNDVFCTQQQRDNFKAYIQMGGGFVGIHSACGTERDWPWFWAMLGGKFVRHAPFQRFDVLTIDPTHQCTKGVPERWTIEEECYYLNHLNPDIDVIMVADMTTVEDEKRDEYPAKIFGDTFPLVWSHTYDGGRQWYTALGHDPEIYADATFRTHLKGGMIWTMGIRGNK